MIVALECYVMLTPSGELSVCPGTQPSFRCNTNLTDLQWKVTVFQSGTPHSRTLLVLSTSFFTFPLVVNGHSFRVTRDSVSASLPIISTLTVVNATVELNGTSIHCTGGRSSPTPLPLSTLVASIHINTPNLSMFFKLLSILCSKVNFRISVTSHA